MNDITIYGQDRCYHCVRAKTHLQAANIPFTYRDIADPAEKAEMFRRNPKAETVPQIFVGERLIGGADQLVALPLPELQQMIGGK